MTRHRKCNLLLQTDDTGRNYISAAGFMPLVVVMFKEAIELVGYIGSEEGGCRLARSMCKGHRKNK